MSERTPPLAQDLSAVLAPYTWKFGEGGRGERPAGPLPAQEGAASEAEELQAQIRRLTAALEDIVTFALSSADYKERAIMMHRRAVAALMGIPSRPPPAPHE